MPTFPAFKTKPYYDALKTWLTTSLNDDGTIKDSAVADKVSAAIADDATVVAAAESAAAAAVDVEPRIASLTSGVGFVAAVDDGATWQENRDALQAANDAVHAAGGGRVTIPAGTYLVKGVVQDSHVEFFGPGATLKHPDGSAGDIITARTFETTGTIAAGSTTLTVADASNIEVGAVVAIRGAGGKSTRQTTTLTSDRTASIQSFQVASTAGWAQTEYAWIDDELVTWTAIGTGVLSFATRGLYGTTAAAHSSGAVVYQAVRHYSHVTAVNGTTVTIADPAVLGVTGAEVGIGSIDLRVTDVSFDGSRVLPSGSSNNPIPLRWDRVRWSSIKGGEWTNGDLGALQIAHGARDNEIGPLSIRDCGIPAGSKGSGIWLFRACARNRIKDVRISGDCYHGVYIDDRTVTSTEWDAPCDDNTVRDPAVDLIRNGSNISLMVVGGNGNQFIGGSTKGSRTGVVIDSNQNNTHDGSRASAQGNLVTGISMRGHHYPVSLSAPGNRVINNPWRECSVGAYDTGGNAVEANGLDLITGSTFATTGMPVGYHFTFPSTSTEESSAFANSALVVSEWNVPRTITFTEVGIEIVSPASAGRFRFGYYHDDGTGKPGGIAWDAATLYFDLTVAGVQYITVNRPLRAGRYWIGVAMQLFDGATAPVIMVPGSGLTSVALPTRPGAGDAPPQGYRHAASVNGTLPLTFSPTQVAAAVPRFFVNVTA